MQHLDDGTIHALLDGELSTEEAEALASTYATAPPVRTGWRRSG